MAGGQGYCLGQAGAGETLHEQQQLDERIQVRCFQCMHEKMDFFPPLFSASLFQVLTLLSLPCLGSTLDTNVRPATFALKPRVRFGGK